MSTPGPFPDDAVAAALLQITQHAERLALLGEREAQHHNRQPNGSATWQPS